MCFPSLSVTECCRHCPRGRTPVTRPRPHTCYTEISRLSIRRKAGHSGADPADKCSDVGDGDLGRPAWVRFISIYRCMVIFWRLVGLNRDFEGCLSPEVVNIGKKFREQLKWHPLSSFESRNSQENEYLHLWGYPHNFLLYLQMPFVWRTMFMIITHICHLAVSLFTDRSSQARLLQHRATAQSYCRLRKVFRSSR